MHDWIVPGKYFNKMHVLAEALEAFYDLHLHESMAGMYRFMGSECNCRIHHVSQAE